MECIIFNQIVCFVVFFYLNNVLIVVLIGFLNFCCSEYWSCLNSKKLKKS